MISMIHRYDFYDFYVTIIKYFLECQMLFWKQKKITKNSKSPIFLIPPESLKCQETADDEPVSSRSTQIRVTTESIIVTNM